LNSLIEFSQTIHFANPLGFPGVLKEGWLVAGSLRGSVMSIENSNTSPIEDKVQGWQDNIEARVRGIQTSPYARILKMARKPSKEEFRQTIIVCGIGMFILGGIGFAMLYLMDNLLPSFFAWLIGA
jgi:protein transport protein SEC61 subunit gamma-like protein